MENSNDYNFDHVAKEIVNSIRSAKQAKLLDRSYLRCHHSVAKELIEKSNIDYDGMVRSHLIQRLAQQIVGVTQQHIKTEDYRDDVVYSLEVLVFAPEDLKHIVEYCVKEMPMAAINKIKGNEQQ